MANYAMICNNEVIEVLYDQDEAPIWPPDGAGNLVTSVECNEEATRDWSYNPETQKVFEPTPIEYVEPESKPTQLDRIESAINKSHEDIANEAIDNYTLELMEAGVIQ